jgi:hypothetical protein
MAKKRRSYRRHRKEHRHRKGLTLIKGMKIAIATAPVGAAAINNFQASGGGAKGVAAALNTLTSAYTGFDATTGRIDTSNLAVGYVPLFGAWVFGKVGSRVLRV